VIVEWSKAGPCRRRDPDLWFVNNPSLARARQLCRGCPILRPCGEYALRLDVHGVWGGTTRQYRLSLQKQRGITPTPIIARASQLREAPRALALLAESESLMQAGLTLAQAAEHLGVTAGLLKAARARARRHLAVTGKEPAPTPS
jgi:hypothetical protein